MKRLGMMSPVAFLMLLVLASAIAVRNDREVSEEYSPTLIQVASGRWPPPLRTFVGPTLRLGRDLMAAMIVVTAGLGLASLRGPFVPAGRRWPGRGMAAIAAASLGVGYNLIDLALEALADPTSTYFGPANPHFFSEVFRQCGSAPNDVVLGAWSLLALAGRWRSRSEPAGLERLGRLLGWCWLATFAFDLFQATLW